MFEVIDNLNSNSSEDALSANQGKILKGYVDDLDNRVTDLENNPSSVEALSSTEIIMIIGE